MKSFLLFVMAAFFMSIPFGCAHPPSNPVPKIKKRKHPNKPKFSLPSLEKEVGC